ncbi:hypothetical protein [Mucilaginibacter sp. PPCGB 2223]|uniref:hypothetical protein n=1 Tax=Mucilaginibacter sp. PPCGB 2223 TaxID=1886027 RepID=UPI001112B4F6|nr:hypothetical protein [Mucilaginibacter sp. PPCGB 2223]
MIDLGNNVKAFEIKSANSNNLIAQAICAYCPLFQNIPYAIAALNEKEVYGKKIALKQAKEKEPQSRGNNFQRRGREYRVSGNDGQEEIDGNK